VLPSGIRLDRMFKKEKYFDKHLPKSFFLDRESFFDHAQLRPHRVLFVCYRAKERSGRKPSQGVVLSLAAGFRFFAPLFLGGPFSRKGSSRSGMNPVAAETEIPEDAEIYFCL
jgi:hypothetical protein